MCSSSNKYHFDNRQATLLLDCGLDRRDIERENSQCRNDGQNRQGCLPFVCYFGHDLIGSTKGGVDGDEGGEGEDTDGGSSDDVGTDGGSSDDVGAGSLNAIICAASCAAGQPGIVYHYVSFSNWEGFHFRLHRSPAILYTCTVNGKTIRPAFASIKAPPTAEDWFTATVKVTATKAMIIFQTQVWTVDRCAKNVPGGVGISK